MARLSSKTEELFGKGFAAFGAAPVAAPSVDIAPIHPVYNLAAAPANDAAQPTIQLTFG